MVNCSFSAAAGRKARAKAQYPIRNGSMDRGAVVYASLYLCPLFIVIPSGDFEDIWRIRQEILNARKRVQPSGSALLRRKPMLGPRSNRVIEAFPERADRNLCGISIARL